MSSFAFVPVFCFLVLVALTGFKFGSIQGVAATFSAYILLATFSPDAFYSWIATLSIVASIRFSLTNNAAPSRLTAITASQIYVST